MQYQHDGEVAAAVEMLKAISPRKNILEIGSMWGETLEQWMKAADPGATVISVDLACPDGDPRRIHQLHCHSLVFRHWARTYNQELFVIDDDSRAPSTLRAVRLLMPEVDFLFIDGDHDYSVVRADYENYGPLVRKGGLIAFHDIEGPTVQPGVVRFWQEVKQGKNVREITLLKGIQYGIGVILK